MQSERVQMRIAEIASRIAIGPFGSRMKSELYTASGVPVIRGTNLTGGKHFSGDWVYVSKETADDLIACNVVANDLVFPHRGSIGEVGLVPDGIERYVISSSLMTLRCNPEIADPSFIYYFFKSNIGKFELLKNASQVGTPGIGQPLSSLKRIEVSLPPIEEQRAITRILSALDDKIEINRRTNETLEAIVRALFKSRFVDFDGMAESELVESELGLIPRGWRISTIGAEVAVLGGSTPSTKEAEFWEGGTYHWVTPKDLSALTFPVLLDTERKITNAGLAKITSGLLPAGTVLLSSRAPIGYLAITEIPTAINQGFIAMKCDGALSNVFVLQWCRSNMDAIIGNANGSTFLEISKSNFRPLPVVVPSASVMIDFNTQAEAIHRRIVNNERESRALAQLRDALLPKLLSGELRVKDAEKVTGDAA